MNYVMHFCRNKQCNKGWIDLDLTNARVNPPSWKYCRECAEKLGIDYDSQTTTSNLTEKELVFKNKQREKMKKANEIRLQKIKSASTKQG